MLPVAKNRACFELYYFMKLDNINIFYENKTDKCEENKSYVIGDNCEYPEGDKEPKESP